jgi:hypothetical protein
LVVEAVVLELMEEEEEGLVDIERGLFQLP